MTVSDQDSSHTPRASVTDADELLHHHTELPTTRISQWLDAILSAIGKSASWLWVVVTGVIIWAVVGRYVFGQGSVLLEEVQWHLAGAGWLLGLAYTLVVDDHVRVDVIHERLSLKTQAWIELLGLLLLLLPFLGLAVYEMVPYAISSWEIGETSQAPAGLSNRWVLKAVLALAFTLIIVAAVSRLLKVTALLFGFPRPIRIASDNNNQEDAS
ncbi:MAG: TRAP transporter small permease subunit [Gammaproteobacteria bacterium]|uniref:TRAP transporter small permease protein n=1 Tax=Marinobacter nitratireducens TaxID=1137280 RepID=A0A072MWN6_9GAMM|nr:TRAP transporter small permease subunit [Marinobacter nitratireducens]KEF29849.1 TRAP dicarboxylate transporter, DctQ subunit [Marinobacter nitratireducens]TNE78811.1 MAG: TRAP transporter small permease subunit [Gammaproteobacteria bacterium]TNE94171.1 MAG: TRAP transporter small permease subunit [Gammaproteobacteria bacterium]